MIVRRDLVVNREELVWVSDNGLWEIKLCERDNGSIFIMLEHNPMKGMFSFADYPIMYDDGRIVYDYPGAIPKYVKKAIEDIMIEYRTHGKI